MPMIPAFSDSAACAQLDRNVSRRPRSGGKLGEGSRAVLRPLALLLALLPSPAEAEAARVVLVVDGDTLYADLRGQSVKIRVNDLDTPEVGGNAKCEAERLAGERASAFAKQILPAGKAVDVQPTGRREKYGRLLAAVIVDGRDYATAMIAAGHGVRYDGRRKPDWCRR